MKRPSVFYSIWAIFNNTQQKLLENLKKKIQAEVNPSVFTSVIGLATRKLDVFGYYKLRFYLLNIY